MWFSKKFEVKPGMEGYLYKKNVFHEQLAPGKYRYNNWNDEYSLYTLPKSLQYLTVTNQEVLTKDQVALRFSFYFEYRITNGKAILSHFEPNYTLFHLNQKLTVELKLAFRNIIGGLATEELNAQRAQIASFSPDLTALNTQMNPVGVEVLCATALDISFPKFIQELFAKQLEAKIRTQTDLENARTAVATARTLKNASELVKGDEYIRFIQLLELLNKATEKGKHTFQINLQDLIK